MRRAPHTGASPLPASPPPVAPPCSSPLTPNGVRAAPLVAVTPSLPSYDRKRKGARIFSAEEKKILELNYAKNKFPSRLHMETLGKALGKGTEKVRTWYNNRRATDRRQGIDVTRNVTDELNASASFPNACPVVEETVLLPSHVLAHPTPQSSRSAPVQNHHAHLPATTPLTPDLPQLPPQSSAYVNVTPSSISWAPSIANTPSNQFSPSPYASNRFRISPLRIRHVCLSIGPEFLFGELPHNLLLDRGLEVKFLFGKKRVVYEWYYGQHYSMAQSTGGPYCKMEMNFSAISSMHLYTSQAMSMLVLYFSAVPALFLQTQQSMDKYKLRSQQRQYRKVSQIEFPIRPNQPMHAILLRSDEAIRTVKILFEDTPRLLSVFRVYNDKPFPVQLPPSLQNIQQQPSTTPNTNMPMQSTSIALPSSLPQTATAATVPARTCASDAAVPHPVPTAVHQASLQSPSSTFRRPLSIHELSSRQDGDSLFEARQHTSSLNHNSHGMQTRTVPIAVSKAPAVAPAVAPPKTADEAQRARATAVNWLSPSTPYTRASKPWVAARAAAGSYTATPLAERINRGDTPGNGTRVRRELNFNGYGQGDTPMSTLHKRKASALSGKENEERVQVRRRLVHHGADAGVVRLVAGGIPPPPLPPPLPTFGADGVVTQFAQSAAMVQGEVAMNSERERLTQKLPR